MNASPRRRRAWIWWVLVPPAALLLLVAGLALYQRFSGDGDVPFLYVLF